MIAFTIYTFGYKRRETKAQKQGISKVECPSLPSMVLCVPSSNSALDTNGVDFGIHSVLM